MNSAVRLRQPFNQDATAVFFGPSVPTRYTEVEPTPTRRFFGTGEDPEAILRPLGRDPKDCTMVVGTDAEFDIAFSLGMFVVAVEGHALSADLLERADLRVSTADCVAPQNQGCRIERSTIGPKSPLQETLDQNPIMRDALIGGLGL